MIINCLQGNIMEIEDDVIRCYHDSDYGMRLHSETDAAVEYPNGNVEFRLRGIRLSEEVWIDRTLNKHFLELV